MHTETMIGSSHDNFFVHAVGNSIKESESWHTTKYGVESFSGNLDVMAPTFLFATDSARTSYIKVARLPVCHKKLNNLWTCMTEPGQCINMLERYQLPILNVLERMLENKLWTQTDRAEHDFTINAKNLHKKVDDTGRDWLPMKPNEN